MKKILLIAAVMLMAAFSRSQADAEMLMLTATNGSFTFDSMGSGDSLVSNGDNGLSDVAFFIGYQTGTVFPETQIFELTSGTGVTNAGGNTGTFTFDTVTFENGVSVDAVANFRLVDATGTPSGDFGHHVVYDLELQTTGVTDETQGSLESFVGFDFNGNGNDSFLEANPDNPVIAGFGESDIAIGSNDRTLVGDFTFQVGQGGALTTVAGSNTNIDLFNGSIDDDLQARFNGSGDSFLTGDLALGAFNDFLSRDVDQIDTTAGVIGFRSIAATATIPEPSTLLMASMGLGMVAFRRRKRA